MNLDLINALAKAAEENNIPAEYLKDKSAITLADVQKIVDDYKQYLGSQKPPSTEAMDDIIKRYV